MTYQIFIDGGAGTTGLEVADRLSGREELRLTILPDAARKDVGARRAALEAADIAILCLPDAAARESADMAADLPVRLIDTSTAHRIAPDWVYGFAELTKTQQDKIANAKRVSNPGCYPTGFLALTRPLIEAGLLLADARLCVPAISGYSGGGKQMIAAFESGGQPPHFAYGLGLDHKHLAEMYNHSGLAHPPIFMPSVGNFRQGMLVHLPLHMTDLAPDTSAEDILGVYAAHYAGQPLIEVCTETSSQWMSDDQHLAADALAGSDRLQLGVFSSDARDGDNARFWTVARLDNLGKGAAGAAVQNLNIMLGLDPLMGLVL